MIVDDKARELHLKIHAMWQTGLDTVYISRALLMTEAAAERALHAMLENKRTFNKLADVT